MANDINLNTFPGSSLEALTMLYLENQDLSDLSPTELTRKYFEVYHEIQTAFRNRTRDSSGKTYIP
ncbi:hypothetical protein [Atopococcus tabaci]|uniref:hypothetical protein n=1 Tax=Atopococcus tabaci TaxID=269774 RepID=UPI0004839357|nr:hypothetical protein [Atopococcus tabaci]